MKSSGNERVAGISSAVLRQLKELQPEIVFLLTQAPEFGTASLDVHFMDGKIIRVVRRREESVLLTEGGRT